MTSLTTLPAEIVEKIIDRIDLPACLLSFALTSHQFGDVILPYHIGCRIVRCFASDTMVWKLLLDAPLYAQRVRILHIGNGEIYDRNALERYWFKPITKFGHITPLYTVASPLSYPKASVEAGLLSLASAIPHMVDLTRFVCTIHEDAPSNYREVFQALAKHVWQLREFELQYVACRGNADKHLIKLFEPINDLWHLTRVAFIIHDTSPASGTYVSTFIDLVVARCPDLEEFALKVTFRSEGAVNVTTIFSDASWTKLKRLTISGTSLVHYGQNNLNNNLENLTQIMKTFFSKHQKLVALSLDARNLSIPSGSININILPNLKSIKYHKDISMDNSLSSIISEDVARNLVYFSIPITSTCLSTIEKMMSLRACEIIESSHLLKDLVKAVPYLEKLYVIPSVPWRREYVEDKNTPQFMTEFTEILKLTNLTHLGGFVRDIIATTKEGSELLYQLKNLKFVEISVPMSDAIRADKPAWVELERDNEGNFLGYHKVENSMVDIHNWGGFFHGIV